MLSTGIRQNILINIRINDIDFDSNIIHVNVTKNRKPLLIPMNKDIKKILEEYIKYRQAEDKEDYLFCNEYGYKLVKSTLYHAMREYNKKRGVETTGLHRFRHTFAKKWVLSGGNEWYCKRFWTFQFGYYSVLFTPSRKRYSSRSIRVQHLKRI